MLEKGKKVSEYVLLEKLGAGGFGEVWKAEKRTELSVSYFALKFFRPKDDDTIDLEIVKKEIQTWQSLSGLPNVISVIEANRFEDYVFIVSEFAEGGSLQKWLKTNGGKANSIEEAITITRQILQGLEGMHGEGFVHRDLKPANVLLKRGAFYLADFGISRQMKTHSKTNSTAGTYEFMPPEAFEKSPSVTPQTDIWATCAILQVLLTGQLPFPQDEIPSLITAILYNEPEPLSESLPLALREIVKKSLQKKRANRFQSAREMREVLRNALTSPKPVESGTFSQAETIVSEDFDKTVELQTTTIQEVPPIVEDNEKETKLQSIQTEIKTDVRQQINEAIEQIAQDANKTEVLIPEPTKDWNEIEAEKQAQIEQEKLKNEREETERIEREEASFWQKVREEDNLKEYKRFISRYPNGRFANACQRKIARLEKEAQEKTEREQKEQTRIEQERLQRKKEVQQKLEWEKFQREAKADSTQREIDENLHKQKEAETAQKQEEEKRKLKAESRKIDRKLNYWYVSVIVGIYLFIGVGSGDLLWVRVFFRSNSTSNSPEKNIVQSLTIKNSIGMKFVRIPSGSFLMGSSIGEKYSQDDEMPQRKVNISYDFYLGEYEVTQEEYESIIGINPSSFKNCPKCPVENISWNDAKEFIKKLNAKNDGYEYRLPSEAEWEYTARAGTTTAFAFGDSINSSQANFNGRYISTSTQGNYLGKTSKGGSYKPNPWGLYDMHGNVWEWVEDVYNPNYQNLATDGSANLSTLNSSKRVLRGGSWTDNGINCRSAIRDRLDPVSRNNNFGFRLVARVSSSP